MPVALIEIMRKPFRLACLPPTVFIFNQDLMKYESGGSYEA